MRVHNRRGSGVLEQWVMNKGHDSTHFWPWMLRCVSPLLVSLKKGLPPGCPMTRYAPLVETSNGQGVFRGPGEMSKVVA